MQTREWTSNELGDYVTNLSKDVKDVVLKNIFEADLLRDFLSTANGRMVLDSTIEGIVKDLSTALEMGSSFDKHKDEIKVLFERINMAKKFMHGIACVALTGERHIEEIKKRRRRKLSVVSNK